MMDHLLWLIPAFPLVGFILLTLWGKHLSRFWTAITGAGSVSLSAILTFVIGLNCR